MILGGYELCMFLGKGGMGEVWLSNQISMQRKVALKILSPALSKDPELIARFINEMKLVAKLDHPGIVSAYEAGYSNNLYFLATSYVAGATLESMLSTGKVFKEKEALSIVRSVAEAMIYAWDKHRILHRDIKPANIMIENGGAVKLMDMGISKSLKEDSSITMTGIIIGTPCYMSPEQAKSEKDLDHRADIYSLGATFYHMLTGHIPYDATNTMGILARVISSEVTSARRINPEISAKCESLISKMMEKDRIKRQTSWQEVIDDIDELLDDKAVLLAIAGDSEKTHLRKDRIMKVSAIIVVFCIVVTAAILISYSHKKPMDPDEEFMSIINEDVLGEFSSPVPKHETHLAVPEHSTTVQGKNTLDEKNLTTMRTKTGANSAEHTNPEKNDKGLLIYSVILSKKLDLNKKEMEKAVPIVKEYFRDLRQIKENRPSKGYFTLAEFKETVDKITADTQKSAETVLGKDKAAKLMQLLEEKRKTAFRNYLSPPSPRSQNK